jgi:hypothetical protein
VLKEAHASAMKKRIPLVLALLLIVISCEDPETTVTNYVRRDGSVLRKAELKYVKNELDLNDFGVPVDSTWKLHDSISFSADGDTLWFLLAEKLFVSVDDINKAYLADTGKNSRVLRAASFHSSFKWFTTTWHFTEKCSRSFSHGYPAESYLTPEDIELMNLPSIVLEEMLAGPDSLRYKGLADSLDTHTEKWFVSSLISEWIEDTKDMCAASDKDTLITETLRSHETEFETLINMEANFDKTCSGILGDSLFQKYKPELDSAMKISEEKFDRSFSFKDYTMKIVMPLKARSTNGYTMPGGEIAWPVKGELFLTEDYIMWAETRDINYWAIFLTALALVIIPFEIKNHGKKQSGKK